MCVDLNEGVCEGGGGAMGSGPGGVGAEDAKATEDKKQEKQGVIAGKGEGCCIGWAGRYKAIGEGMKPLLKED